MESNRLSNLIRRIFCIGLFILPLVFWPGSILVFEVPRVWFFSAWISLLAFLSLIYFQKNGLLFNKKFGWLLIIYLGIVLFTALIGVNQQRSFFGNYFRGDGINTLILLCAFGFLLNCFWQEKWAVSLAKVLAASGFFVSLLTVSQALLFYLFKINFYVWEGSFGGLFGQPVFLVGYLLVNLPFGVYLFFIERKKLSYLFLIIFNLLALGLTFSWTAVFGLVILAALYYFVLNKTDRRMKKILGVLAVIILGCLYYFYNQQIFAKMEVPFIAEARPRVYTKIFLGYLKRPFFGWGWANIDQAFLAVDYPFKTEVDVYVDKAHSHFLEVLTTAGIFGLTAYLLLIIYCLRQLIEKIKQSDKERRFFYQTLLISFLFFLIHSQTNIISISEEIYFWLILGAAVKT